MYVYMYLHVDLFPVFPDGWAPELAFCPRIW
jgi:hypothetical protein